MFPLQSIDEQLTNRRFRLQILSQTVKKEIIMERQELVEIYKNLLPIARLDFGKEVKSRHIFFICVSLINTKHLLAEYIMGVAHYLF